MSSPSPAPLLARLISDLRVLRPALLVATGPAALRQNAKDKSYHLPELPLAVIAPDSEADIVAVLSTCNRLRIPVIPVAGRTSLEAHTIPHPRHPAVILDTSSMDKIIALHPNDLDVVLQPGVPWIQLRDDLLPHGLFFPPDPGAGACIGGMCGTNCSGTLAYRYGTMKDNVVSMRVVLADGRVVVTRRRAGKSSAGFDLARLFVGSEGCLGVVSEVTLRLRVLPKFSVVAMCCFLGAAAGDGISGGGRALAGGGGTRRDGNGNNEAAFSGLQVAAKVVGALVRRGTGFLRMEIMDEVCVQAVNLGIADPRERFEEAPTLIVECAGGTREEVDAQLSVFRSVCQEFSASENVNEGGGRILVRVAEEEDEQERLWRVRKRAFFAATDLREGETTQTDATQQSLQQQQQEHSVLVTDVAVPVSRLVESLSDAKRLLKEMRLVGPIVAHAGDGNYHVLLVVKKGDEDEIERAERFRDLIARRAIAMDGTCTGEHGIGKGKRHLLIEEVGPEAMHVMKLIKNALDPNNIMNPGNIFLEEGDGHGEAHSHGHSPPHGTNGSAGAKL